MKLQKDFCYHKKRPLVSELFKLVETEIQSENVSLQFFRKRTSKKKTK